MTTDDDLRTRYNPLEAADAVIADLRARLALLRPGMLPAAPEQGGE